MSPDEMTEVPTALLRKIAARLARQLAGGIGDRYEDTELLREVEDLFPYPGKEDYRTDREKVESWLAACRRIKDSWLADQEKARGLFFQQHFTSLENYITEGEDWLREQETEG